MNCSLLLHLMNWHEGERERKEGGKDRDSYLTHKSIWKEGRKKLSICFCVVKCFCRSVQDPRNTFKDTNIVLTHSDYKLQKMSLMPFTES